VGVFLDIELPGSEDVISGVAEAAVERRRREWIVGGVIADATSVVLAAGGETRPGQSTERRRTDGVSKRHARVRERVERRRPDGNVTVEPHPVGVVLIRNDDQHVGLVHSVRHGGQ